MPVSVSIQYCGGGGYAPYSSKLKTAIEKEFGPEVSVAEIGDPGATGNFEVKVNDDLIHSKKTMGHDRCENTDSTRRVIENIKSRI